MSAIDKISYIQLENIHKHLFALGEPLASTENFIRDWWDEEDAGLFHIGCPDFHDRNALVYLVHAARALNAGERQRAIELLVIVLKEVRDTQDALGQSRPS